MKKKIYTYNSLKALPHLHNQLFRLDFLRLFSFFQAIFFKVCTMQSLLIKTDNFISVI